MAEKDIKHLIRQEYLKCAKDPSHFMKKYCFIQHPQRGRIQFGLYPFQDKVLNVWKDNPYSMVLKSRQLGISTLASGYSLWLMTFHKDRNILALATTQATARNLISKIQFMWENLPSWLKVDAVENNKLSLRLSNGSKAQAKSSNADAARSEAVSLLIIDEAAFIDNIAETWASAQQTLATGGGAIVLSTPYGTGNWFHKMWVSAESQENDFIPIKLPWFVHPERDQEWRDKQDTLLGDPMLAAQECDCDFSTSGNTVFTSEWLEFIKTTTIQEPMERRGVDQNLWVWEAADYSRDYMIVADVARGDGKDFSGCHVMDVLTNTQVAEYKGQLPPKEFGYFLTGLATEYNNAMLVVENANIGWATLDAVQERGYRNLYHSPKGEKMTAESYLRVFEGNSEMVPGFTMSMRTRPLCINKMREFVGDNSVTIRSKRLLEEMKVFIWKNGRPEAQGGYNDDLVMPFSIGMFLRDTSLKFQQQGLDSARAALNNIQKSTTSYQGGYSGNQLDNPYKMDVDGNQESISWLF
ncbi:terminase family protein [bacterium]|jgi:hypothetical protein|nr:terminase family protein [bacterium]MDB4276928.1 terminase family protein [bacterium]MDB9992667.1 terminase family protein [bacterium]